MSTDVEQFLRMQKAVDTTLEAFPIDKIALAGKALTDSYNSLRNEVKLTIPQALGEEFDRLFPELDPSPSSDFNLLGAGEAANVARGKLALLAGWLKGIIEQEK